MIKRYTRFILCRCTLCKFLQKHTKNKNSIFITIIYFELFSWNWTRGQRRKPDQLRKSSLLSIGGGFDIEAGDDAGPAVRYPAVATGPVKYPATLESLRNKSCFWSRKEDQIGDASRIAFTLNKINIINIEDWILQGQEVIRGYFFQELLKNDRINRPYIDRWWIY